MPLALTQPSMPRTPVVRAQTLLLLPLLLAAAARACGGHHPGTPGTPGTPDASARPQAEPPVQCTPSSRYPQWPTFHPFNAVTRSPGGGLAMEHLNDANAIFDFGGLYHAMAQTGGSNWSHVVTNDLAHWWTLPDALDGQPNSTWDGATCDGTVSFPDLGRPPYDGATPVLLYGPDCGGRLPPLPPAPPPLGDYPRVAVALPAQGGSDPYLVDWVRPRGNPVVFDGVPCSFPGRVWKSEVGEYWNMLCAWDGRAPWARYTTHDPTLLAGWALADVDFATDASGGTPAGGGAGALFHKIRGAADNLYMINLDTGSTFGVGRYDPKAEKLHLRSDASGKAERAVLDYGAGVYKWVSAAQPCHTVGRGCRRPCRPWHGAALSCLARGAWPRFGCYAVRHD